ncbi:MAG TPA: zf-HC2 domain-containing protein [Candidatus Acidoferrum sp.]|nr:zf-HC2 domain-containing protein [Candidatus Acidoferrum sp.]
MIHPGEVQLIAYRDGEMKEQMKIQEHLKECARCRAELERIETVLAAMNAMPVPDPGEDYGRRVWQQISPRLQEKAARWWQGWFEPRRLVAAGAVAALVIAAFVAGFYLRPHPLVQPNLSQEASVRQRVLWLAVGEHLGRTEMMLMELANAAPKVVRAKQVDITSEQRRAESLLEENRLYRQTALQERDPALVSILDSLDRVLLDVAHSPDEIAPAELEVIQHRISEQGLLLKIRVVRQDLLKKGEEAPLTPTRNNSTIQERNKT